MKKFLTLLSITLLITILLPFIGDFNSVKAYSQDYKYEFACDLKYEVDYITDDGKFEKVSCHSDLDSAKAKMRENYDYVVRHKDAYSPSRIIAMNDGIVYAYPRSSSDVIKVYEGVKGLPNNTETYVDRYFELAYIDTTYMSPHNVGEGYAKVCLNGFVGYVDLEYTDLIPSKFIDKQLPLYVGGKYGSNSYTPYQLIGEPDYYTIETNGNYNDLVLYYHNAYARSSTDKRATVWSMSIGSATDYPELKKGIKYYSCDGVNFYDSYKYNNRNYVTTGYNYYQFLPLRSKTKISADTINNFLISKKGSSTNSVIKNKGSVFMQGQEEYGSNAAIVFAMACWESGYGTSGYAVKRNNLFGWLAYDDNPDNALTFSSVDKCIIEHAGGNLRDYSDVYVKWFNGAYLGNKGSGFNLKYASDPYWGAGIASIYYSLDKYASNKNGKLVDHGNYELGIVKTLNAPVYKDTSASDVWFNCKYSDTRNLNYMVSILEDTGTYYKIQLSNPITDGKLLSRVDGPYKYDWNNSVGYIKKSDIKLVTDFGNVGVVHNAINIVDNVSLDNETLSISGIGIITNYNFNNNENVRHVLNIYNMESNELVKSVDCENINTSWYNINDGCDYTYGGFKANANLAELANGSYYFKLKTTIDGDSKETRLFSYETSLHLRNEVINNRNYRLMTNDIYGYRYELDINSIIEGFNEANVNKPSIRTSLATVDSINFEDTKMILNGVGIIYYSNFDVDNKHHTLYLVNDDKAIALDTKTSKSEFDFKKFYNSSYNMNYVCYQAEVDCTNLDNGNYRLVLKIENGEHVDYIELTNEYKATYNALNLENVKANIITSNIRSRMILKIEKVS